MGVWGRIQRSQRFWPWLVALVGLGASVAAWQTLAHAERQRHQADFDHAAALMRQDLEQRLLRCERVLDASAVYVLGMSRDNREAWSDLAARLHVGGDDWCSDALSWYPRVTAEERAAALAQGRAWHGQAFDFRPPGERALMYPLLLALPDGPLSRRFLGLDPWANPKRRADMAQALASDRYAASPVQRFSAAEYVVLRYRAVRRDGQVFGFLGAPLRLERLAGQLQAMHPRLGLALVAADDQGHLQRLQVPSGEAQDDDLAVIRGQIEVGGRALAFEVLPLAAFHGDQGWPASALVGAAGAALALMAALLVAVVQRSGDKARQLAAQMSETAMAERAQALRAESERRLLVEMVPIGVVHVGMDHRVVSANRAAHQMLGYADGELAGLPMSALHDEAEIQRCCAQLSRQLGRPVAPGFELFELRRNAQGEPQESEWTLRRRDGSAFSAAISASRLVTPEGHVVGSVRVFTDISERQRHHAQLRQLALHDALTGLPNRVQMEDRVREALADPAADRAGVALMLLDLDRFKQVNDTLGHAAGDELLREVARRLALAVRPTDLVARMGGDEFAVLLGGVREDGDALAVAARIDAALHDDLVIGSHRLRVSTSIGIARHPAHGHDLATLLKCADLAMYRAKAGGRGAAAVYDAQQDAPDALKLQVERDLRQALAAGQLEVHYQPLVDARSGLPRAVEALLRWRHPSFGMVPPNDFIPVAEETGDIVAIGAWALETACADIVRLRREWPELGLAVNLSGRQFEVPDLDRQVADILQRTGLPPAALELEITERLMLHGEGEVPRTLHALRAQGVGLAVDDFGTGYSALSYLNAFPMTTLKIDRAFVSAICDELPGEGAPSLASAIVALARSLGLHTVAEGVETEAQQRHLAAAGCNLLQGYLFSHALPANRLEAVLRRLSAPRAVS